MIEKHALIYPMATYIFYVFIIAIATLRARIRSVRDGSTDAKYFKTMTEGKISRDVALISRHYNNQFELPLLYYITCLAAIVLNTQSLFIVGLAWSFIAARLLHSYIHLGSNHILKRAIAFGLGWVIILAMWALLVFD